MKMGKGSVLFGGVIAAIALSVSCSRDTDLLYHVIPPPALAEVKQSYQIKDLKGDNKIDVLWVIDNSGSMGDDQQKVISNTKLFMEEFVKKSYLDWKMALISTDENNSPFMGMAGAPLDRTSVDPVSIFQSAVSRLGTSGAGLEKFFTPVMRAMRNHPNYFRDDAMLAIILISDAPEQSHETTTQVFLDFLQTQKKNLNRVLGYGVLWPADWGCGPGGDDQFFYAGSKYEQFFSAVSGKTYPLCKGDFGPELADLTRDIVKRVVTPRLPLAIRPKVSSIRVTYQGNDLPGGLKQEGGYWLYDFRLNAIVFHDLDFAPTDKEEVTVTALPDDGF